MSGTSYQDANGYIRQFEPLKVVRLQPNAEEPTKESNIDPTYDLSVIARDENRVEDIYGAVNVFTTGLYLEAPKNYHVEIVEHPQLYKAGYFLVGGPRIIVPGDTSEITIPLYKYKEADDLELPFRVARVVLRPSLYVTTVISSNQDDYEDEEDAPVVKKAVKPGRKTRTKNNHMF